MTRVISSSALQAALALRDLTDPDQGPHAMQHLVDAIRAALEVRWKIRARVERGSRVVPIEDNYDALGYPTDGAARDARYSRRVSPTHMLRSQTSAVIPPVLRALSHEPAEDILLLMPGLVYRRDMVDRLHTGEPHQMDLWRLTPGRALERADLLEMISTVLTSALPGKTWRLNETQHPYTVGGLEMEVRDGSGWIEVGECGLMDPRLLDRHGLDSTQWSGLAMGVGLDRLLMLRKGMDDIRLIREPDPRVQAQMLTLDRWHPVSRQPPVRRDLSPAVAEESSPEELGDRAREALGDEVNCIEEIAVQSQAWPNQLPISAITRMGLLPGQKNVLLRVVIRHPVRTLTSAEANVLRDRIYLALHQGSRRELAGTSPADPASGAAVGDACNTTSSNSPECSTWNSEREPSVSGRHPS